MYNAYIWYCSCLFFIFNVDWGGLLNCKKTFFKNKIVNTTHSYCNYFFNGISNACRYQASELMSFNR